MQVRLPFAIAIFLASYLPLSVILFAQNIKYSYYGRPICLQVWSNACELPMKNPVMALVAVAVCSVGLLATFAAIAIAPPKKRIKISSVKYVPADLMNYVLPYVVSFMGIEYGQSDKFVGFIIFLSWIFLITYKSGQVIMNPVLSVFGWRLYEIEFQYVGGEDRLHSGFCLTQDSPESKEVHRSAMIQDVIILKQGAE